jgi:tetratricopeptide (TPR) repeat protein
MKIFLSGVSSQFKACRDALRSDLSAVGAAVVVQEDFQQHGASLLEKLESYIASCDRVIALVGDAYGFEPEEPARPLGRPRRSHTQWEYFFAMGERLDGSRQPSKYTFLYLGSPEFLAMHPVSQADDAAQLQQEFIKELLRSGKDRNGFTELHQLRALVLRDGFQLRTRPPQPRNLPYTSIGRLFKGREHALADLHERLQKNPGRALVIYGPAGVGKTRLTIEYAMRHEAQYTALLDVGADSGEALQRNLAALCGARVLNLPERQEKEQELQVAAVQRWLSEHSGWLLILDNADTFKAAEALEKELLPQLRGGHVIITSRFRNWSGSVETVHLELLSKDAAVEFLLERTKNLRVNDPSDPDTARKLAEKLEGLALGLEQAGAFINQMVCSFDDYLRRWHARKEKVDTWHNALLMHYPLSVAVTWDTSFEQLGWAARDLLNLLSWLAPEPIPRALTACAKLAKQNASRDALAQDGDAEEALAELAGFSMLKWETGNRAFRIYRLVRDVIRERQPDEQRSVILQSALLMVYNYLPDDPPPHDVRSWPIWETMVAHVRTLIAEAVQARIGQPTSRLASMLGIFLAQRSLRPEPESLMRLALEINEQMLGPEHPDLARDLYNLAQFLRDHNRLSEAEPLMWRALAINENWPDLHNVARVLNELALLLNATNRSAEAESLMRRALSIDEKTYGAEHPDVARDLNNLAHILQNTNRLTEAEPLMRRALSIDEKTYGAEHPLVAIRLNNLAQLLQDTNRLTEAEALMRRALAIDEKSYYGLEHPNVAIRLDNLAQLLQATNRLTEAEALMRRALAIDEKSYYGPEHPNVAIHLNNLAVLLKNTNRLTEAEALVRRALAIHEKSYGPEHPTVANDLDNLALLLKATNRLTEAEPLMRRALSIDEKGYGAEHPKVARHLGNLAQLLQVTNRLSEAEPLRRRCLQIVAEFGRRTGHEDPHFRTAINSYAGLLAAMGLNEQEIRDRVRSALRI